MKVAGAAVALQTLRTLSLRHPLDGGQTFLAAASGLVVHHNRFYVVADDELRLGVFRDDMQAPGDTLALLPGALPHEHAARKRAKPDFEALLALPATATHPHGTLLALGSGSRDNRTLGVQLAFDATGDISDTPTIFECAALYAELAREFGIVNIEGAVVEGDRLLLLQRGNKKAGINAFVHLDLECVRRGIVAGAIDATALLDIRHCELGSIDGVALGFTDATRLPDGQLLALAVAEDTDDPYTDGAALGSYLCRFDREQRLQSMTALQAPAKTEGIALWPAAPGGAPLLLFVTDADDATLPARLLAAPLRALA